MDRRATAASPLKKASGKAAATAAGIMGLIVIAGLAVQGLVIMAGSSIVADNVTTFTEGFSFFESVGLALAYRLMTVNIRSGS